MGDFFLFNQSVILEKKAIYKTSVAWEVFTMHELFLHHMLEVSSLFYISYIYNQFKKLLFYINCKYNDVKNVTDKEHQTSFNMAPPTKGQKMRTKCHLRWRLMYLM